MRATVVEVLRGGERTLLAADEAHALALVGTDARHLYETRPAELDVVFLLDTAEDQDHRQPPGRAFSSYASARAACGPDDWVAILEIEP